MQLCDLFCSDMEMTDLTMIGVVGVSAYLAAALFTLAMEIIDPRAPLMPPKIQGFPNDEGKRNG